MNTLVRNRGAVQTITYSSQMPPHKYESVWDANYNGKRADIVIAENDDGKTGQYAIRLTNEDLAEILNMDMDATPLDKRLEELITPIPSTTLSHPSSGISSPKSGENYLVPITIDRKSSRRQSSRRKRRPKTHITHRAYKRKKHSSASKRPSKRKSKGKSKRSTPFTFSSGLI